MWTKEKYLKGLLDGDENVLSMANVDAIKGDWELFQIVEGLVEEGKVTIHLMTQVIGEGDKQKRIASFYVLPVVPVPLGK
jgi:hypothetical protein